MHPQSYTLLEVHFFMGKTGRGNKRYSAELKKSGIFLNVLTVNYIEIKFLLCYNYINNRHINKLCVSYTLVPDILN